MLPQKIGHYRDFLKKVFQDAWNFFNSLGIFILLDNFGIFRLFMMIIKVEEILIFCPRISSNLQNPDTQDFWAFWELCRCQYFQGPYKGSKRFSYMPNQLGTLKKSWHSKNIQVVGEFVCCMMILSSL